MAERRAAGAGDPYRVLEVAQGAEPEVIDAAYRALARKHHPDVNRDPGAAERMREINAAYAILRNPAQRARIDAARPPAAPPRAGTTASTRAPSTRQPLRPAATPAPPVPDRHIASAAPRRLWRDWRRQGATGARQFALGAMLVLLVAGAGGAGLLSWRGRAAAGSLPTYWRVAAAQRARVEAARQRCDATITGAGFDTVAGSPPYIATVADLAAALGEAQRALRAVPGEVPPAAVSFHFAQLADWDEERQVREAQRDAAGTRNAALWAQAVGQEAAWRSGTRHQQVEALARELAAAVEGQ